MKALIVGWFSFTQGHATAGDLMSGQIVGEWLEQANKTYDIALDPPFSGGVDWRCVDPAQYSHVIFVCGPFQQGTLEADFFTRFAGCRLIGLSLTMLVPLQKWQPFDFLIERDSSKDSHADLVFLTSQPKVPVVGVCKVESYAGARDDLANAAIYRLLDSQEAAIVDIDTRLDSNSVGLRTPSEIESLIASMDVLITTRLHGMVMALKNGVPVIAIDPEAGGAKIKRQAELIGWPMIFVADQLEDNALKAAFEYCLTDEARQQTSVSYERAVADVQNSRERFIAALNSSNKIEDNFSLRNQQLVSVIIPCYKQAHYLRDSIESVLAQSYSNYEIIVVDDGSPDNTAEVAKCYPVRYIRQENQGLSGARNTGLKACKGKYLIFLDADDRLTSNALRSALNAFHTYPECAFVSGHHRYIKGDGSLLNEHPPEPIDDDHYIALLKRNYIGMHATVMYRRSIFDVVGKFDTSLKSCEDYDLYLRIASRFPIYRHPNITAEYRRHDSNMTYNSSRMLNAALTVLRSQWASIQNNPIYIKAYCAGIRFWCIHFSKSLIAQTIKAISSGEASQFIKSLGQFLKILPFWFLSVRLELQGLMKLLLFRLKLHKTPISSANCQLNHATDEQSDLADGTFSKPL